MESCRTFNGRPGQGSHRPCMKIIFNSVVFLAAAAIGLAAGFALRPKHVSQAPKSAGVTFAGQDLPEKSRMQAAGETRDSRANDDSPLTTKLELDLGKCT